MPRLQPDSLALIERARSEQPQLELLADDSGVDVRLVEPRLGFYHSFVRGPLARRARQSDQALLRACNNRQRTINTVLDLTAGWGADSLSLARHGRRVLMLEQNSAVFAVINHALACLAGTEKQAPVAALLRARNVNAFEYLSADECEDFDCIFLDPMFPPRKSGARAGKEMQILQALTENLDIEGCFESALERAHKRVVVKRPARAPRIDQRKPDLVQREKSVRFDIYLTA